MKKVMGGALKPTDIIQGPEGQEGPTEVRYRAHVAFSSAAAAFCCVIWSSVATEELMSAIPPLCSLEAVVIC